MKVTPPDNSDDRYFDLLGYRLTLCLEIHQRYCGTKLWEMAQNVQAVLKRSSN
jgi:hypothetical protein